MEIDVYLVNSFTDNGSGGNPAGVVLIADHLSYDQKLTIAQAVAYSETAFVSKADQPSVDFELSFFTTTGEVDFCGHATLAAFSMLYKKAMITHGRYVQRTKAGLLAVVIEPGGFIVMELKPPEYLEVFASTQISALIGIPATILDSTQLLAEAISTGLPDVIVPVPLGYLDQIQINEHLLTQFCKDHGLVGLHAFELCDQESSLTASCRNFAPLFGIPEESATGSSSGALACYLSKYVSDKRSGKFIFEQGRAMNCRSIITASVECRGLSILKVEVGGLAQELGLLQLTV
ncbi:PhzF family phenazine biosynthesis protein [Alginatibacterium sediminis]|uniref:PhzF family phenazine biosynthesis protein n=1 Tax=Alginatibacterium sediminis TaxID=2164068 RepID=A0A420EIF6_9ALTE|nr:PhzF family phenazine biosynthesis protein [Alginatibacterium sediminis]